MHLEGVPPFLCWSVKHCYRKGCSLAMHLAFPSSTGVVMFKDNNGYPGVICSPSLLANYAQRGM